MSFSLLGIARVVHPLRGGDYRKKLLSRETKWILDLGIRFQDGLNIRQDLMNYY